LSGFAILLGLFLKPLGLCAEFNSASNGAIFTRSHWPKSVTCAQNTGFTWGFSRYLLSRFTILLGLFLKLLELGAKFNSAPNGAIFTRDHRPKSAIYGQNTDFHIGFSRYLLSEFAIVVGLLLKPLGLGAKFHSAPNTSGLRSNPSRIANPDKKKPNLVLTLPTYFIFKNFY
jgi:hypothetical protein